MIAIDVNRCKPKIVIKNDKFLAIHQNGLSLLWGLWTLDPMVSLIEI